MGSEMNGCLADMVRNKQGIYKSTTKVNCLSLWNRTLTGEILSVQLPPNGGVLSPAEFPFLTEEAWSQDCSTTYEVIFCFPLLVPG